MEKYNNCDKSFRQKDTLKRYHQEVYGHSGNDQGRGYPKSDDIQQNKKQ